MFVSRTPKQGRRRKPLRWVLRGTSLVFGGAIVIAATLLMFALLTTSVAQACPSTESPTPPVTFSAAQVATAQVATVTHAGAVSLSILESASSVSSPPGASHGNGVCCTCWCCPAHTAGLTDAGWIVNQKDALRVDLPRAEHPLLSADLDTQFRPPRMAL